MTSDEFGRPFTRSLSDLPKRHRHCHSSVLPQPAAGLSFVVFWPVLSRKLLHYQYIVFPELKIVKEVC